MNVSASNRWHIFPGHDFIRLLGVCFRPRRSPRQDNHIRTCLRYLPIGDLLPGGNHHLAAANTHQFCHPGRGTDAWIRPGLTIDAHPSLAPSSFLLDSRERAAHLFHQCLGSGPPLRNPAQQSNVRFDISERPRVHSQEGKGLLEEFTDRLLLVRHGADHQRWLQPQDFIYRIRMPAIAQFRKFTDGRDVSAPLGHADQNMLRANGVKNRSGTRRQRNNPQWWSPAGFRSHPERISDQAGSLAFEHAD